MNGPRAEAMRRLGVLKQDYTAQLGNRIDEIVRTWQMAAKSDDPIKALLSLLQGVHPIAGTAGMFGLQETSRAASALEQALDSQISSGRPSEAEIQELDCLVQALRRCHPE